MPFYAALQKLISLFFEYLLSLVVPDFVGIVFNKLFPRGSVIPGAAHQLTVGAWGHGCQAEADIGDVFDLARGEVQGTHGNFHWLVGFSCPLQDLVGHLKLHSLH